MLWLGRVGDNYVDHMLMVDIYMNHISFVKCYLCIHVDNMVMVVAKFKKNSLSK